MAHAATYTYNAQGELLRSCSACEQHKPLDQFQPSTATKDKLASRCDECEVPKKQRATKQRAQPLNSDIRYKTGAALTRAEWAMLRLFAANKCLCCKERQEPNDLRPAYIKPQMNGGSNSVRNRQPLCTMCEEEHEHDEIDFRPAQYTRRLLEVLSIRDNARRERYKQGRTLKQDGKDKRTASRTTATSAGSH